MSQTRLNPSMAIHGQLGVLFAVVLAADAVWAAPPESFDALTAGRFRQLQTVVGTWESVEGISQVDPHHGKSGRQCLQLTGGERTVVVLRPAEDLDTSGVLSFWAERWTSRTPFSFRIEKSSGDGWQEIYNGDRDVRVGRAFLNHVKIPLVDAHIRELRFTCVSPPGTGILIDDVHFASPRPQKIINTEVVPCTLPALVGESNNTLIKLSIETDGLLTPISVVGLNLELEGRDVIESLQFVGGAPEVVRSLVLPDDASGIIDGRFAPIELADGRNILQLRATLKPSTSIDGFVGAGVRKVHFSNGQIVDIDSGGSRQRLGIAVRDSGDDGVHTYRIPGLATTIKGTLIGVYDIRRRSGRDLPGDIDVGMSRSTDGGQSWEPMRVIMDMGDDPQWRYDGIGDPAVLVDQDTGTIWVAATWSHGNRSWLGSGPGMSPEETGQLMLVRSDDDGLTWSKPINITSQVKQQEWCFILQGPGKGITMHDGTIVFAAQFQDTPDNRRLPHSTIIYSRDHGLTWKCGTAAYPDTTEAQVVEVEPGVLMLNCRYNRKSARVVMTTSDMGETWVEHSTSQRSLIEPGACMASLIDVDREVGRDMGGWLLFSNPDSLRGRNRITIKASNDGGRTWPKEHRLLLDEQISAGYSCMSMIDDSMIGILYEGSQAHLTFQRIPLKEITDRTARVSEERLRTPLDVFVVTGQSNSLGTVDPADHSHPEPPAFPEDSEIDFFWSNRSSGAGPAADSLIGDSGGRFVALQVQQGQGANPVFWGPEFGFARTLYEAGKRNFAVIKASRGGGGNSYWLKGAVDDHMYQHVLQTVRNAVDVIPDGRRYRIRGVIYVQGESDNDSEAREAGSRLGRLISNLRTDLPYAEDAVLLVGGIAATGKRRDDVRRHQAAEAELNAAVEYVDNLDLRDQLYDQLHFNRSGKLTLGQRLAERWLSIGGRNPAQVQMPSVFGSHMVLQADTPIAVWGKALPGSSIRVQLDDDVLASSTNANGEWKVVFPARPACATPVILSVNSGKSRVTFRDVVVGEVWICAGQSNMEWPVNQSLNGGQELASLNRQSSRNIRLLDLTDGPRGNAGNYQPRDLTRLHPKTFADGQWKVASAETVRAFSAVGWYFGRRLQSDLNVPVGLICPAVGGSPAESWIPRKTLAANDATRSLIQGHWLNNPRLGEFCPARGEQNLITAIQAGEAIVEDSLGPNHPFKPGFLWSAAISPLVPYAIRGVIWYQGESNAETAERVEQHRHLFPLLVQEWRRRWNQGDFPFVFVQLPGMGRPDWPEFRDDQRRMQAELSNVGMAVTIDVGHPSDVHPRKKITVGERLALWAIGTTYRKSEDIVYSSPLPKSAIRRNDTVFVTFDHCGEGLVSADEKPLRHFELAGPDGAYHTASAVIASPNSIEISCANVLRPTHVRYAWQPYPEPDVNLFNSADLPASPFAMTIE